MLKNTTIAAASIVLLSMLVPSQAGAYMQQEESYEFWCYSGGKVLFSGVATESSFSNVADACRKSGGQLFSRPVAD